MRFFATRWAMSYLRGPLTRNQVALLTRDAAVPAATAPTPRARDGRGTVAPSVAAAPVTYLHVAAPWAGQLDAARTARGCGPTSRLA